MKFKIIISQIFLFFYCNVIFAINDSTDFRIEDRIRIREAINVFNESGKNVWKNWTEISFPILLVTNENEYLMNHQNPTEDFVMTGYDSIIESNIYTRSRLFNNNSLATFPAVNGEATIVVGLPENTNRSSFDWVITILHEHFHQLQYSEDDYYISVNLLDLAGDDKSGMWMLNYPFPYEDETISNQYKILTQSAKETFQYIGNPDFENKFNNYAAERQKFKELLNEKDYKYFSFQTWQEGIARYTEIKIAELLNNNYNPTNEFKHLNDYITPDSFYVKIVNKLLKRADSQNLTTDRRNCFYTLGALEGLILDNVNPGWKDLYFKEKFYIENYYGTHN